MNTTTIYDDYIIHNVHDVIRSRVKNISLWFGKYYIGIYDDGGFFNIEGQVEMVDGLLNKRYVEIISTEKVSRLSKDYDTKLVKFRLTEEGNALLTYLLI